jgi:hypothetical protein
MVNNVLLKGIFKNLIYFIFGELIIFFIVQLRWKTLYFISWMTMLILMAPRGRMRIPAVIPGLFEATVEARIPHRLPGPPRPPPPLGSIWSLQPSAAPSVLPWIQMHLHNCIRATLMYKTPTEIPRDMNLSTKLRLVSPLTTVWVPGMSHKTQNCHKNLQFFQMVLHSQKPRQ